MNRGNRLESNYRFPLLGNRPLNQQRSPFKPAFACNSEQYHQHQPHGMDKDRARRKGHLIDAACILTHNKYRSDLDSVIYRASKSGVGVIIIPGMTVSSSRHASKICQQYPGQVFFTAGVHPHNAHTFHERDLEALSTLLKDPNCVGMGEVGLDFNRNFSPREQQIKCFEKQLELACKLDKPLLLHERDSHEEFIKIMTKQQSRLPPTLVHCFTGSREHALVYLAMGYYIGITGHFVGAREDEGVKALLYDDDVPLDKLILETDGPFMLPQPERAVFKQGIVENVSPAAQQNWDLCVPGRNEPCTLPLIAELVAGCMRRPAQQLLTAATHNAMRFFRLHDKAASINIEDDFL